MKKRIRLKSFTTLALLSLLIACSASADGGFHHKMMMEHPCAVKDVPAGAVVGKPAPDFDLEAVASALPGHEFSKLKLGGFRGKWLIILFYPADFTTVCPTEIKGFSAIHETLKTLNTEIVGVSTDSKWSHLAWIKQGALGELKFPLLADFNKQMAQAYGALNKEDGTALRALFIIDPQGVLQYQVIHSQDVGRSSDETLRVLEALQTGGLCPLGWKPGQKTLGK